MWKRAVLALGRWTPCMWQPLKSAGPKNWSPQSAPPRHYFAWRGLRSRPLGHLLGCKLSFVHGVLFKTPFLSPTFLSITFAWRSLHRFPQLRRRVWHIDMVDAQGS